MSHKTCEHHFVCEPVNLIGFQFPHQNRSHTTAGSWVSTLSTKSMSQHRHLECVLAKGSDEPRPGRADPLETCPIPIVQTTAPIDKLCNPRIRGPVVRPVPWPGERDLRRWARWARGPPFRGQNPWSEPVGPWPRQPGIKGLRRAQQPRMYLEPKWLRWCQMFRYVPIIHISSEM